MKSHLLAGGLALLLVGCAAPRYTDFRGPQVWPTTRNASAVEGFSVPVYWNWPERPYRVLGSVQFANAPQQPSRGFIAQSARLAKRKGGDAVIILQSDALGINEPQPRIAEPLPAGQAPVLVIKWKSRDEVEEDSHRLDGLRAYLRRSYPALGLSQKHELWQTGVEYVTWLGLDINSPRGAAKLEGILSSLIVPSNDTNQSKWLFKGSLRMDAAATARETILFGIATVTRAGDSVIIASQLGEPGIQFRGHASQSQWQGQFDLTSTSSALAGQAEGTIDGSQISLSCQGQALGKELHGTFRFLR